jgi:hypothetical protein
MSAMPMTMPMYMPYDPNVAQAAYGVNAAKSMSFNLNIAYDLPEPKTGLIANLLPSDSNWHPLYDHGYKEIAGHLFSIQGLNKTENEKTAMNDKVKNIVIESYSKRANARMYWTIIILVLLWIIKFLFSINNTVFNVILIGISIFAVGYNYYNISTAKGEGDNYWTTFASDFSGKVNSGITPSKILEGYGAQEQNEKDRAMLQRSSNVSSTSLLSGSALGSFLGATAATIFKR